MQPAWRSYIVLSQYVKEAILKLDITTLNAKGGMQKLQEKLDLLFLADTNQSSFMTYASFKQYQRQPSVYFSQISTTGNMGHKVNCQME